MLRRFLTPILLLCAFVCTGSPLRVKVSIDTTDIYAIDHSALLKMGFAHPEKVGVFGSGGVEPANHRFSSGFTPLATAPYMHTADRLLFYGEGTVRATVTSATSAKIDKCFTADRACYYLAETEEGGLAAGTPAVAGVVADTTHLAVQYLERDIISPANGGAILLSHRLVAGSEDKYTLDFEGLDIGDAAPVYVYCSYGIKNSVKTVPDVKFSSGIEIVSMRNAGVGSSSSEVVTYRPGFFNASLRPAPGTVFGSISIAPPSDFKGNLFAVDYLYTITRRSNVLHGNRCSIMHVCPPVEALAFNDAPLSLKVWNVTPGTAPVDCPMVFDASTAVVACSATSSNAIFVAFDSAAEHPAPIVEGVVSEMAIDTLASPEMLIIAAPALREQAEELADIHRHYDDMEVLVVDAVEIFDNYSDGLRTPMAFRRLARQFYADGNGPLKHILLYGAADVYNKRINEDGCCLVSFQAENIDHSRQISTNYCCDQYFGMLDDGFNPDAIEMSRMQVNVGRIPATSPAMAAEYNRKVRRYYELGPDPLYSARAFLLSGPGDDYIHYRQSDEFAALLGANPLLSVARGDSYFYRRVGDGWPDLDRTLAGALSLGSGLLAFAGHNNPTALSNIDFNFIEEHRYSRPPLGFFASCESFAFDHPDFSIGRLMLMRPDGGVLGLIAACRTTVLNHNRRLGVAVAQEYAALKPGDTWGDLFRRARNRLLDEKVADVAMVNTLCYNYGGDPALPFYIPSFGIAVEGDVPALKASEPALISGRITNTDGSTVESFSGTVEVNVHCSPDTLVNLADSEPLSAIDNHRLMARAVGHIEAGRFTLSVTPPLMDRDGAMKITIGATGNDGLCALGVTEAVYSMDGNSAGEIVAPILESIEVDTDEAFSRGVCTLHAKVRSGAAGGVNIAPVLGKTVSALLDGHIGLPDISLMFADGGDVAIEVPFATPAPGRHSVAFSVSTNNGARLHRTVEFVVARPKPTAILHHTLGPEGVARERIEFSIEGTGGECARLLVTDGAGHTVYNADVEAWPCEWNLCRSDGSRVPDGLYRATVMFPATTHATPYVEFVVLGAQ